MKDRFMLVMKDFISLTDAVKMNFKTLENEMALLKRAIIAPFRHIDGATSKIKVFEPKFFNGNRNLK